MDLSEIKQCLQVFASSEIVDELNEYYSNISSWEISGISRNEPKHTLFLNWFFNNNKFSKNAIYRLLLLLQLYADKQKPTNFSESLSDSLYIRGLDILSCSSIAEFPINLDDYGDGNIDLFIKCEAKLNRGSDNSTSINIVIENKLYSPETTKATNGQTLYQTDAYYKYVTETYPSDLNIFVFLKPISNTELDDLKEPQCNNKNYIQINYQELLDCVIQPILKQLDSPSNDTFLINDYVRALSKPSESENSNITIMAIPEKEKELLKKFFEQNETLIRAAIESIGDQELTTAMQKAPSTGTRRYKLNSQGSYTNVMIIEEFVKKRLNAGKTIDEINTEINSYIAKKSHRINVCDVNNKVYREDVHFYEFKYNNQTYKVSKEWSDKQDGHNFWNLRLGINKQYNDFQIEQI